MIVQDNNSKLSKSIAAYIAKYGENPIRLLNIQQDIYRTQFMHQSETRYLFHTSSINNAIVSFINEYSKNYQIYLYHDIEFKHPIINQCYNIVQYDRNSNPDNSIVVGNIINNILFYPINKKEYNIDACMFLNNHYIISDDLFRLCDTSNSIIFDSLYPSQYNLGITTEEEKNIILNNCTTYIDITNEYGPEASLLGCNVLQVTDKGELIPATYTNCISIDYFISDVLRI